MIRYSLRQLDYLVACVEAGSIAAAAARLNVSQPSVSTAIAKLEADLGVQLLLRHHAQGVSPTAAGERLAQSARNLLTHAEELQREAQISVDSVAGELRLGGFVTLAPVLMPPLLAELRRSYPSLRLRLSEGDQDLLVDQLRSGRCELALLYDLGLGEDLRLVELTEVHPYVLLPAEHSLARRRAIALADLADEPFILFDVPPSRDYFSRILRQAGVEPRVAFSSPSLELVRGLVGRGLGYSLLVTRPQGDMTYDGQRLAIRAIKEPAEPSRIVLAALEGLRPTRAMAAFQELAIAHFARKTKK